MRKLKGTEKPNHCKNCIPCIRGKAKSTSHYKYDMMHRLKTEYQRCSAKTRLRVSSNKCKILLGSLRISRNKNFILVKIEYS